MSLVECPECGKEISDKAASCIHCGYPLHGEKEGARFCPYCGKENDSKSVFCAYCGRGIDSADKTDASARVLKPHDIMSFTPEDQTSHDLSDYYFRKGALDAQKRQYDSVAKCPQCGSTSLSGGKKGVGLGKAAIGAVVAGPVGLLAGGIGMNKAVVTCMNCGYQFSPK
ncbi:zinc ribbon domain-containing protein [Eggerthella sinensis]|uniref:zinc ribbon domain-containing protein n=1 Tax=Eggerthella sinensis TaxID=242230 RepID=UPI001D08FD8F|nr:zinc ribbon domain-containing protein [Eggerthella sinensis]MCB7038990.1 zinc ribbon domain-containing protein [Eggerthella sinensis]